jgi:Fe2+ transport system protein FeoA
MNVQPLSSLQPGERGVVTTIDIPPEHRGRILEMGLLPGTTLEIVRYAPLGDPVEIRVRGYHLSLRRHEADRVMVRQP